MLDFLMISYKHNKDGSIEVFPKFIIKKSKDLMIRGGDFYAVWVEELKCWSTDEDILIQMIDSELKKAAAEYKKSKKCKINVKYMWDSSSGMIDIWHKYCQRQLRDSFVMLDETLIFANSDVKKEDYASKKLPYSLEEGSIESYNKLMSVLYSPEERAKIEWAIGSIVSGDSKKIQKFMVLYGSAGTGKSTVLNIIQKLFDGYYSVFDAKALGSSSNSFALEAFKTNPLVAIQHDGDLSKIEDNTRLNSLVSHESMSVNEKFKSAYANQFKCFLFMGTNKPVKITDAKSGLIRRLIDVSPTGDVLEGRIYKKIIKGIDFELGSIAYHCLQEYLAYPDKYDGYIPTAMLGASNDFYNFVIDSYSVFKKEDGVTLKAAWQMYKEYCEEARVIYPFSQRIFKEELKSYFEEYRDRFNLDDGTRVRSYYSGFKTKIFDVQDIMDFPRSNECEPFLQFKSCVSIFDEMAHEYIAQYASSKETPSKKWEQVTSKLKELDTSKLHYVQLPEHHIVIDFDIKDESGNKSLEKNLEAAGKWPKTYAEVSKSGKGIHLHYFYTGDPTQLKPIYDNNIEIKVFKGGASLRRMYSKSNGEDISKINSGLPLKESKPLIDLDILKNETSLRKMIEKNLRKEYHPSTKSSIDFINKILEDAYKSSFEYDVSDMFNAVLHFAASSTNQSEYCVKLTSKMKFKSEYQQERTPSEKKEQIVFYDVEIFPNLFLCNWKLQGKDNPVVRMINPTSSDIEALLDYKLVGFNCRRYDNHILYGRLIGYDNTKLYELSQRIIEDGTGFFREAYNISYTDVYDFSNVKQSLKKFQIDLGLTHKELGLPWNKPVDESLWAKISEYCDNDVLATEAVFDARAADFTARQILAEISGMTVNDTTNSLSTRIIFGNNRNPQNVFNYRDMGDISQPLHRNVMTKDGILYSDLGDEYTVFTEDGKPIFPGYKFEYGVSTYRGEEVGEGGRVYSEPGMYGNAALLDVVSMHPYSTIAEQLFGEEYTKLFEELVLARVAIKRKDFESAKKMLNGVLEKYLVDEDIATGLAYALKIVINSIYGLTSASFNNPFRDPRNKDNIVAKRGALFMINLQKVLQAKGIQVIHVKTDSIKIPDATEEIINFVTDYGAQYGYIFEHEATYDKICLVNNAVYVAKYKGGKNDGQWVAVGTEFQKPYVFKKLFSKEDIEFADLCEAKSVKAGFINLDMNENLEDVSAYEKELEKYIKSGGDLNDVKSKELIEKIDKGHNYIFVGRIGNFCPIKDGFNGGILYREKDGKYYAVTGTKGYRWLESEVVEKNGLHHAVNLSYHETMVEEAIEHISQYGDFDWFISDEVYEKHRNGIYPF